MHSKKSCHDISNVVATITKIVSEESTKSCCDKQKILSRHKAKKNVKQHCHDNLTTILEITTTHNVPTISIHFQRQSISGMSRQPHDNVEDTMRSNNVATF